MRAAGFSLVECVMATLVLSAGVLAVVASSAATQRLSLLARNTAGATQAAASRLDSLALSVCAAPAAGSTAGRYHQQWTVTPSGVLRLASLVVSVPGAGRTHLMRFDAAYYCPAP
jgi:Tfp pilus assembly protein PilV